jgi:hypothetical protein
MVETTHVEPDSWKTCRKARKMLHFQIFVIEIAFGFTLVEKKSKERTMKNRNSKACCN